MRVSTGRMVIEVAEPERVSQAEILAKIARVAEGWLPKRDWDHFAVPEAVPDGADPATAIDLPHAGAAVIPAAHGRICFRFDCDEALDSRF